MIATEPIPPKEIVQSAIQSLSFISERIVAGFGLLEEAIAAAADRKLRKEYREKGKSFFAAYHFFLGEERCGIIPIRYTKDDGTTDHYLGCKMVCLFVLNDNNLSYFVYNGATLDTPPLSTERREISLPESSERDVVAILTRMAGTAARFATTIITGTEDGGHSLEDDYAALLEERI